MKTLPGGEKAFYPALWRRIFDLRVILVFMGFYWAFSYLRRTRGDFLLYLGLFLLLLFCGVVIWKNVFCKPLCRTLPGSFCLRNKMFFWEDLAGFRIEEQWRHFGKTSRLVKIVSLWSYKEALGRVAEVDLFLLSSNDRKLLLQELVRHGLQPLPAQYKKSLWAALTRKCQW